MSLLDNLPHECKIVKKTSGKGTLGGRLQNQENVYTQQACWEQQASAREIMEFEKQGIAITHKIYFNEDLGITEQHQIIVTKRNGTDVAAADQVALDVVTRTDPDASAGLQQLFKVMANRRTGSD